MKLKVRYFISGISTSMGCLILYLTGFYYLGSLFLLAPCLLIEPTKINKPFKLKFLKWNSQSFFKSLAIILGIILLIIVFMQIPDEKWEVLVGKWYFTGPLLLFSLSINFYGYFRDKE
jgi:hypothetical protein